MNNHLLPRPILIIGLLVIAIIATPNTIASDSAAPAINYLLLADDLNEPVEHQYPKNDGPDKNPLKGWNSGWWNEGRDETSVGFQYIPWRLFEPENNDFDNTVAEIENIIERAGSKDRHLILRIYCDWGPTHNPAPEDQWQGRSRGCPEWMYDDVGVEHFAGVWNGESYDFAGQPLLPKVTDFNDSKYLTQAEQVIAKFADLYDDDPRIFTIQLGFLGYWGEWHTFGSNLDPNFAEQEGIEINEFNNSYVISSQAKQRIINAFNNNFTQSIFVGRYPYDDVLGAQDNIGFHNDFFMPFSDHSADFDDEIYETELWKNGPIGGEIPPEFNTVNGVDTDVNRKAVFTTDRGLEMIETGHYTTMQMSKPTAPDELAGYMALHKRMGYNYQIEKAVFAQNLAQNSDFNISLFINNIGVAPIYHSWDIEFALLDNNNNSVVINAPADYDLQNIMPDDIAQISGLINTNNLDSGLYKVGVRIIQPGSQVNKTEQWQLLARNTYIEFSNDIETIEGFWNANYALEGAWAILGNIRID